MKCYVAGSTTLNTGTSVLNDVVGSITWSSGVTLQKTAGGNAPPFAAIQMLRKNPTPAERKMFDSIFGAGAATKALEGR